MMAQAVAAPAVAAQAVAAQAVADNIIFGPLRLAGTRTEWCEITESDVAVTSSFCEKSRDGIIADDTEVIAETGASVPPRTSREIINDAMSADPLGGRRAVLYQVDFSVPPGYVHRTVYAGVYAEVMYSMELSEKADRLGIAICGRHFRLGSAQRSFRGADPIDTVVILFVGPIVDNFLAERTATDLVRGAYAEITARVLPNTPVARRNIIRILCCDTPYTELRCLIADLRYHWPRLTPRQCLESVALAFVGRADLYLYATVLSHLNSAEDVVPIDALIGEPDDKERAWLSVDTVRGKFLPVYARYPMNSRRDVYAALDRLHTRRLLDYAGGTVFLHRGQ